MTYDTLHVIPLIKAAQAACSDPLRLFGSPWSPPGWMKTNGNMISSLQPCLKNDTGNGSYAQAWADYIVQWIRGFEGHGVSMWGLTPQNEPGQHTTKYEGCLYSPTDMQTFIRDHLGPTVKAPGAFPDLKVSVLWRVGGRAGGLTAPGAPVMRCWLCATRSASPITPSASASAGPSSPTPRRLARSLARPLADHAV